MQPDKAATDRAYNAALRLCIDHLDRVALCAGTHNEESAALLALLVDEKGIPRDHPHLLFAQLLGMSDHISFNLTHHGYRSAKYLPYGPVKAVLPYLFRRAGENSSIAGQSSRELGLLSGEMARRRLL
jgi:proline dehydrogenase